MTIVSSGFGFEIEVTAKVAKLKCVVYEVPISCYGRTYEEGKKITYLMELPPPSTLLSSISSAASRSPSGTCRN